MEKNEASEERTTPKLRLKNGAMCDVRVALEDRSLLNFMHEVHPEHFQSLLALAKGQAEHAVPDHVAWFEERGYVTADGGVREDLRDVLLSSYQTTREGPMLLNPFALDKPEDLDIINAVQRKRISAIGDAVFRDKRNPPSRG
jgi:hypothetical protein